MYLVIVESPTKARKLSGFLGKDYRVESSVGHIVDLPKSGLNIDFAHNFQPKYEIMPDKKLVVAKLQKLAKTAKAVILASDPDREGEAIAWHLQDVLTDNKLDGKRLDKNGKFQRATFHEITKQAVLEAINHPGKVNLDLVHAQQARRLLDRIVGYQVSPILWKKVRRGLSAGRVQSVALRLIVEREKEIRAFVSEEYWEFGAVFSLNAVTKPLPANTTWEQLVKDNNLGENFLYADLIKIDQSKFAKSKAEVEPLIKDCHQAVYKVSQLNKKQRQTLSYPPFTTSTMQQAAANKLGFSSKQTMTLAQQLYEEGFITYHRTDSFNLSTKAVQAARSYIKDNFGEPYLPEKPRVFSKKSKNAQEAHEAIRVTDVLLKDLPLKGRFSHQHAKLYDLIWRRFVASQMAAAVYDQTTLIITGKSAQHSYEFKTTGSIKKFAGWTKLFVKSDDRILPPLQMGQTLYLTKEIATQKFTQPPARYNDASIIKKLEELGIGRPSTYAAIISVILSRGYVEKQQKKFFATSVGETVADFLLANMSQFMEYNFTAFMEEQLDEIARGQKEWTSVLSSFYEPFSKNLAKVEKAARAKIPVEETGESCPLCGESEGGLVVIRQGRYGKFKSCSRFPDCKYTQNMQQKLEGVACPLCGEGEVVIKPSRWGKNFYGCSRYPECDWASWSKPNPGDKISQSQWQKMQAARLERKALREKQRALKASGATQAAGKKSRLPAKKATKKTAVKTATKSKK